MNIQVDPTSSHLAFSMLNSKIRPRAVVGYGVKIFHPGPPNYVTRSPGYRWEIEDITWPLGGTNFIFECWKYLSRVSTFCLLQILMKFLFYFFIHFRNSKKWSSIAKCLSQKCYETRISSYKGEIKKIMLISSVWKSQNSNKEEKNSITLPSSHLEAILWMKFQINRQRAWARSSIVIG